MSSDTDRLSATETHEALDVGGHLSDAHAKGVYSLEVPTPDAADAVQRAWLDTNDHPLPDAYAVQLADASRTLYVGASGDVYARIMDHAKSDVRTSSFVATFGFTDVVGVWPGERSGRVERDRARALSDGTTRCWCDGEIH